MTNSTFILLGTIEQDMKKEIDSSHLLYLPPQEETRVQERLAAIEKTISVLLNTGDRIELQLNFPWLQDDYPELADKLDAISTPVGGNSGDERYTSSDTEYITEFLKSLIHDTSPTDLYYMVKYVKIMAGEDILLEYIPESEDVRVNLQNGRELEQQIQDRLEGTSAALLQSEVAQWQSGNSWFLLDGATLWLLDGEDGDRRHGHPLEGVERIYIDPENEQIELDWNEERGRVAKWLGLKADRPEILSVTAGDEFEVVAQGFENLANTLDQIDLRRKSS